VTNPVKYAKLLKMGFEIEAFQDGVLEGGKCE
jgi:hypothetical protein